MTMKGEAPVSALKALRSRLGLTLRDVEEITEGRVSNPYLCQLENGKITSPSVAVCCDLAAAYCTSLDAIVSALPGHLPAIPTPTCPTCGQSMFNAKDTSHDHE